MRREAPLAPYTTRGGAGPGQKNDGGEGEEGGNGNAGKITCQIKKERERNGEGKREEEGPKKRENAQKGGARMGKEKNYCSPRGGGGKLKKKKGNRGKDGGL